MTNNWEAARLRSRVFHAVRDFFDSRGYLEVETPLLSPDLIPESTIETFSSCWNNPYGEDRRMSLIPSPEIWMKKILAEGSGNIYQICKSFRNCEQRGRQHNPEFSMLEWYGVDIDYRDNITLTEELMGRLYEFTADPHLKPPYPRVTMDEAFSEWAGFSLSDCPGREDLREKALSLGFTPETGESWSDLFNLIFIDRIEPALPAKGGIFITDYPSAVPTLARDRGDGRSERWELYLGGVELANCYTEENRPNALSRYFSEERPLLKEKRTSHGVDTSYRQTLERLPACSGTALGMDRLIMTLSGIRDIRGVIFFSFDDIMCSSN